MPMLPAMAKVTPYDRVKQWRAKHALSLRAAAPAIGISVTTLNLIELGQAPRSLAVRRKLLAHVGIPLTAWEEP